MLQFVGRNWKRQAAISAALLVLSFSLPFVLLQYRAERLHCHETAETYDCVAGDTRGALVFPLGLIVTPPDIVDVNGIYVRKGYSNSAGRIGGFWLALLLFCTGIYVPARLMGWWDGTEGKTTVLKIGRMALTVSVAAIATFMVAYYFSNSFYLFWPILVAIGGISLAAVACLGIVLARSVRKSTRLI